ncbi:hypothetical protein D3C83_40590 [compost metagenome]
MLQSWSDLRRRDSFLCRCRTGGLNVPFRDECRGGSDQLRKVLESIRSLLLRPVMLLDSARLDHMIDDLRQGQASRCGAHRFDEGDEGRNAFRG